MADELLPIPKVPDGLREAALRGNLIPFIGAGVSRIAGGPSWGEFADATLRWLINDGKFTYSQLNQVQHLNPRVKLSLARTLADEKGTTIDFRALLHPYARKEQKKGCRLYNSLFALGRTFVTTNYDEWLDERIPETTRPVHVMDDGAKTYIQMPIETIHRELPVLVVKGPNGSEMVNYRVKDNTYIVDRLFDRAALLLGSGKHQVKVELIRQAVVGGGKTPAPIPQAQAESSGAEAGAKP